MIPLDDRSFDLLHTCSTFFCTPFPGRVRTVQCWIMGLLTVPSTPMIWPSSSWNSSVYQLCTPKQTKAVVDYKWLLLLSLTSSCHCLIWWRPAHNLVASSQQALDIRECKAVKLLLVKPMFHLSKVLRENMYMQKKPMQMFVCYNVNCVFYGPGMTNLRNCRNDTRPTPLANICIQFQTVKTA